MPERDTKDPAMGLPVEAPEVHAPGRLRRFAGRVVGAAALVAAVGLSIVAYEDGQAATEQNDDLSAAVDEQQAEIDRLRAEVWERAERERRTNNVVGSLTGVDPDVIAGEGLDNVSDLPGSGMRVSPEAEALQRQSTVQIGFRPKGSSGPFMEWCNGTKITNADGEVRVASAAHCFRSMVNLPLGVRLPGVEVDALTWREFGVLDPELPSGERGVTPLAIVESLALDTTGQGDQALLSIREVFDPNRLGHDFNSIASVPAGNFVDSTRLPTPGQEVALYSVPVDNDADGTNEPMSAIGRYVGRITDATTGIQHDIVAVPQTAGQRTWACDYGASGSTAQLAGGGVLGSLGAKAEPGDFADGEVGDQARGVLEVEGQLGVDLQGYNACYFNVVPQSYDVDAVVPNPFAALERALDIAGPDYRTPLPAMG